MLKNHVRGEKASSQKKKILGLSFLKELTEESLRWM
jgi:hypothetical protein